ncbi:RNA polymerase II transcription factor B subunit 4 [Marasmius tenuissimus]|uniref:General transcription and DNA repair factor IIH subunit TFB4 n=1 Tax=Marasmius tenuissimus TaxID=585030 RepID=A0ABR3A604_9AGAR|nr:RNA polymerase II transcription factor B subunit 4 [Marasmius tenuissimus]
MDRPSHLSVIVDLDPSRWTALNLPQFISNLLAFLNAHIAAKHENTLAVFGAFPAKSVMLYSSLDPVTDVPPSDANSYPPFKLVDSTVATRITRELELIADDDLEGWWFLSSQLVCPPISVVSAPVALVGALTKALCYINRLTIENNAATANSGDQSLEPVALPDPRILILSVSPDLTSSYIPVMNSIFSAQKLKVTIDACQISGSENVFLQQATHLTGGSYICAERQDALLQYLTMALLPPPSVRKTIAVPTQDKIDFRATCFCHKNIVDIGFVCSVCLSIFCQPVPVCSTCRTKFPIKTLQRLNSSRPPLLSSPSSASAPGRTPPPSSSARPSTTPRPPATPSTGGDQRQLPRSAVNGHAVGQ